MEADQTRGKIEMLKHLESPSDIAKGIVELSQMSGGRAMVLLQSANPRSPFELWFDPLNMQLEFEARSAQNTRQKLVSDIAILRLRVREVGMLEVDETNPLAHMDAVERFAAKVGFEINRTRHNYPTCLTRGEVLV